MPWRRSRDSATQTPSRERRRCASRRPQPAASASPTLRDGRRVAGAPRLLACDSSASWRTGRRRDAGFVAARFHATVAAAVLAQVERLHRATGIADVALSGGVFQNSLLLETVEHGVAALGLRPHTNTRVPANDAGISLGQAFLFARATR